MALPFPFTSDSVSRARFHRSGIGIVGIIDQGLSAFEVDDFHPHGKGLKMFQRLFGLLHFDPEEACDGNGREGIRNKMPPQ